MNVGHCLALAMSCILWVVRPLLKDRGVPSVLDAAATTNLPAGLAQLPCTLYGGMEEGGQKNVGQNNWMELVDNANTEKISALAERQCVHGCTSCTTSDGLDDVQHSLCDIPLVGDMILE